MLYSSALGQQKNSLKKREKVEIYKYIGNDGLAAFV